MKTYALNPLSLEPGGETIIIEYQDGVRERHTKIKFPNAYKNKVLQEAIKPIRRIYVEASEKVYYDANALK